jgi:hypothetical protein
MPQYIKPALASCLDHLTSKGLPNKNPMGPQTNTPPALQLYLYMGLPSLSGAGALMSMHACSAQLLWVGGRPALAVHTRHPPTPQASTQHQDTHHQHLPVLHSSGRLSCANLQHRASVQVSVQCAPGWLPLSCLAAPSTGGGACCVGCATSNRCASMLLQGAG